MLRQIVLHLILLNIMLRNRKISKGFYGPGKKMFYERQLQKTTSSDPLYFVVTECKHSDLGNNELQKQTIGSPQHWPGWRRWLIRILTSFCFFGYLLVNITRCHSQPQYCRKSGIMENYPNLKKNKNKNEPPSISFLPS